MTLFELKIYIEKLIIISQNYEEFIKLLNGQDIHEIILKSE